MCRDTTVPRAQRGAINMVGIKKSDLTAKEFINLMRHREGTQIQVVCLSYSIEMLESKLLAFPVHSGIVTSVIVISSILHFERSILLFFVIGYDVNI